MCAVLCCLADVLVYATPENKRTCMLWVNDDISARGQTDIKTPLTQALRMLKSAPLQPGEIRLPLVFLLTDGEHDPADYSAPHTLFSCCCRYSSCGTLIAVPERVMGCW